MDKVQKARNSAAAILTIKMHTCRELCDKLIKKGFDKELAEQVTGEFISAGFLNDAEYASMYISDQATLGAKGTYRIKQELIKKGVSLSIIEDALACADIDTQSTLREYITLRGLCDNIHTRRDLEKLKARLARRGFSLSEINSCLAEYTFHFED